MKTARKPRRYVSTRLASIKVREGTIVEWIRNKKENKVKIKSSALSNNGWDIEESAEINDSWRDIRTVESKEEDELWRELWYEDWRNDILSTDGQSSYAHDHIVKLNIG